MTGEESTSGFEVSVDVDVEVSDDVSDDVSTLVSLEVSVVAGPQAAKTSKAPKAIARKRLFIIVNPF